MKREMVFPAYAGVILFHHNLLFLFICVPRVCGGDPRTKTWVGFLPQCSPRMRG